MIRTISPFIPPFLRRESLILMSDSRFFVSVRLVFFRLRLCSEKKREGKTKRSGLLGKSRGDLAETSVLLSLVLDLGGRSVWEVNVDLRLDEERIHRERVGKPCERNIKIFRA